MECLGPYVYEESASCCSVLIGIVCLVTDRNEIRFPVNNHEYTILIIYIYIGYDQKGRVEV